MTILAEGFEREGVRDLGTEGQGELMIYDF